MEQIYFILTTPALDMAGKAAEMHSEHSAPKGKEMLTAHSRLLAHQPLPHLYDLK